MEYDDSPGNLVKSDCNRCKNTGIDPTITGEQRVRLLLVKLDDAIYWRERVTTPEDRVEAIEHVALLKARITELYDDIIKQSKPCDA